MTTPSIGPAVTSTILSNNYRASIDAWCEHLHQHIHTESVITKAGAEPINAPYLEGLNAVWLANDLNEPWLRIVEIPNAIQREPFKNYGWLSLEISVEDVDELYRELLHSPFEIIGEPADLNVSDDIRAMQVVGPDGEVLYLTEVKAEVPPFQIPQARCAVDKLFIGVALVPDRDKGTAFYSNFSGTTSYEFDTKITVINAALGYERARRHPVSMVQLAGENMIELDQVDNLIPIGSFKETILSGIAAISFEVQSLPAEPPHFEIPQGPFQGRQSCFMFGAGGELLELIEAKR